MKTLRIACTIIAAVFVGLVIPLGATISWAWAGLCALMGLLFFGLMMLCKQKQEENDKRARHDSLSDIDFGGQDNHPDDSSPQK